jgi:hypothetical protein
MNYHVKSICSGSMVHRVDYFWQQRRTVVYPKVCTSGSTVLLTHAIKLTVCLASDPAAYSNSAVLQTQNFILFVLTLN